MKQTAVQWLEEKIKKSPNLDDLFNNIDEYLKEAKEMEKQQIIDAVDNANKKWRSKQVEFILDGKQYYNEKFKIN